MSEEIMAEFTTPDQPPVVQSPPTKTSNSFFKRELGGATFLTLEHVAHMALVLIVPFTLTAAFVIALAIWMGLPSILTSGSALYGASAGEAALATSLLGLVAALLVLTPWLWLLDRRTRAEWKKRPGYTARVAYKLPLYTALAVTGATKLCIFIGLVGTALTALALIGVPNTDIGAMFVGQFVPQLIMLGLVGAVGLYLFKLAKGRDHGKMYSLVLAVLASAMIIAGFITATVVLHKSPSSTTTPSSPYQSDMLDDYYNRPGSKDLEDLFNNY